MAATATLDRTEGPIPARAGLSGRLRSRLRAWRLDQELARGADPCSDPALELRARRLLSPETRTRIADTLEEVVRDACRPLRPGAQVPLRGDGINAARPELQALAAALRAHDDPEARGVALARLLIVDGASPLYGAGSERELAAAAGDAYRALRHGSGPG
jgi:hypothetical protein